MQAVGRLIRSESDVGAALLIDDRYLSKEYLPLFENKWSNYKVITKLEDINQELRSFYMLHTQNKDANK